MNGEKGKFRNEVQIVINDKDVYGSKNFPGLRIMLKFFFLKGMFVCMTKVYARIEKPKVVQEMLLILSFFIQKKSKFLKSVDSTKIAFRKSEVKSSFQNQFKTYPFSSIHEIIIGFSKFN